MQEVAARFQLLAAYGPDEFAVLRAQVSPEVAALLAQGVGAFEVFAAQLEEAFYVEEEDALYFLGLE